MNVCYTIYKMYTKPALLLTIVTDLTLSLRHRFRKPSFSPVHTYTRNRRFPKSPLWRAFSKTSIFGCRKRRLRVDATAKRRKKPPFSKISGYVWTGPMTYFPCVFLTRFEDDLASIKFLWNRDESNSGPVNTRDGRFRNLCQIRASLDIRAKYVRHGINSCGYNFWLYSSHSHIHYNFTNITYAINDILMAGAPNHALKRISVTKSSNFKFSILHTFYSILHTKIGPDIQVVLLIGCSYFVNFTHSKSSIIIMYHICIAD